jgi:hypothetical protein
MGAIESSMGASVPSRRTSKQFAGNFTVILDLSARAIGLSGALRVSASIKVNTSSSGKPKASFNDQPVIVSATRFK